MVFGTSMLQNIKAQSDINREPAEPEIVSGAETLQFFVSFVRRQFPVIAFLTLLAIALGVIYLITARSSFTAQAQMMIDAHKLQVFQQQSILGDVPIDTAQVESQIEVLKSENVASAVIKNLHLTEDPEFVGSGGGLMGTLFSFVLSPFGSDQDQASSEFELNRRAVHAFQDRLSVKRVGLSYVIQIGFQSYDPERAAQIANAIADAYIVDQLEAKYQATRRASVWLQDRIKELRDQVSTAERAVVEFKTKNNIISTGSADKPLLSQQQVAELSSQLVIARAQTAEARARLDRIDLVLKADLPNASFGATVTDTLKSEVVSKLRSQYLELAAREADWSAKYGHDHIAVVNLRNQMREIRNSIFQELKRLGETYKSDYEIAKQREEGVQKELSQSVSQSQETDAKSVSLRELQSTDQRDHHPARAPAIDEPAHHRAGQRGQCRMQRQGGGKHPAADPELGGDRLQKDREGEDVDRSAADNEAAYRRENDPPAVREDAVHRLSPILSARGRNGGLLYTREAKQDSHDPSTYGRIAAGELPHVGGSCRGNHG